MLKTIFICLVIFTFSLCTPLICMIAPIVLISDAIQEDNPKRVSSLIEKNPGFTFTPLFEHACQFNALKVITYFATNNLFKDFKNQFLMAAIRQTHLEAIRILIVNGSDVNYQDNTLPLDYCLQFGHYNVADLLIKHGANVNKIYNTTYNLYLSKTTLLQSYVSKSEQAVEWLMQNGVDPDTPNPNGLVPLFLCLYRLKSAQVVCAYGANPNVYDHHGITLLSNCLRYSMPNEKILFIALLIAAGADVNLLDKPHNQTLLHIACSQRMNTIAAYLLNRGARKDIKNKNNQTPIDLVKDNPDLYAMLASDTLPPMPVEAIEAEKELSKLKQKIL